MRFIGIGRKPAIRKILCVMKISVILILISLQTFAIGGLAQKVTLDVKNERLAKVLKSIEQQTGYRFTYSNQVVPATKEITLQVKDEDLSSVLNILFKDLQLDYREEAGKVIIIFQKSETTQETLTLPKDISDQIPPIDVHGRIVNEKGEPVAGASVKIKGSDKGTSTNENGEFIVTNIDASAILVISGVNIETLEIKVNGRTDLETLRVQTKVVQGEEVTVSTGYQKLKPNEITGSVVLINNEQLNRSVSSDILTRLQGITSGLQFKGGIQAFSDQRDNIQIRSASTILSNSSPLIIVDNFPYEGDINSINPNNVESITILKDAAAASIWGTRAANGVIVITMKKGSYNKRPQVNFSNNVSFSQKPDLFYSPTLSSSDYIGVETFLFNNGYYDYYITAPDQYALTPAVEILTKRRNGLISAADSASQLSALKKFDVRNDLLKYYFSKPVFQQYALNISGGNDIQKYFLSAGYDHNLNNTNSYDRYSLDASNTYSFIKHRLEISTDISLSQTKNKNFAPQYAFTYPYGQLADDNGNPLPVALRRQGYIDTVGGGKLLDWHYLPLKEREYANNKTTGTNYRLSFGIKYKIIKELSIEVNGQYVKEQTENRNLQSLQTYYTRDLINQFTNLNQTASQLRYPIPMGGILDLGNSNLISENLRGQFNYTNTWNQKHSITAVAGAEVGKSTVRANQYRYYGYDDDYGSSVPVDFVNSYPTYITGAYQSISSGQNFAGTNQRYVSVFTNLAYSLNQRYTISITGKRDGANIFGTSTNNKWRPLWSLGGSWEIDKEHFYHVNWLQNLRLRTSYGYQGNVNNSIAALLTITHFGSSVNAWRLPYSGILNNPNPDLRWENISTFNAGIDFGFTNSIISGSLEYYRRQGTDLLGYTELPASSGVATMRRNSADMKGEGLEIVLNFQAPISIVKWSASLLFSYARDRVTSYKLPLSSINNYIKGSTLINPIIGKPVSAIYSYKWGGLDSTNGDPQGYLNGQLSKNYASIINSTSLGDMVYNGPAIAPYFGNFMNNFDYKNFRISLNITYKFGNYFRRNSISYTDLFFNQDQGNIDYNLRWQKPGDEKITNVPSVLYPPDQNRDDLYKYSNILVEKGDNIRLQDIRLGYSFSKQVFQKLPFQNIELYSYFSNIGIIWRANKSGIDPDYPKQNNYTSGLPGKSIALGLNINF